MIVWKQSIVTAHASSLRAGSVWPRGSILAVTNDTRMPPAVAEEDGGKYVGGGCGALLGAVLLVMLII